jgi:heparinase II/III-like protein
MRGSSRALGLVQKLRGRSARELQFRVLQRANVWLERAGLSADTGTMDDAWLWARLSTSTRTRLRVGDVDGLLADHRNSANRFIAGFDERQATIDALRTRWPAAMTDIVASADAIIAGRFDLLGYEGVSFGDPIDWHAEPLSGRRAPVVHWSKIDFLDPRVLGDHKLIWELNRHQHFITLGRAYWLTGDERYATTIVRHIESWMDANPPKIGVNWASSLELSYRAISWVWALSFLRESPALQPRTFARVLAFLDLKARHISRHLSTYFSPNTHLTGEALGLLVLGETLPQLEQSSRWASLGRTILEEQISRQVRTDGSYVEQSPHYHRYTLEIYLLAMAIARRGTRALSGVDERLTAALDHAMLITMPDGTFPLIGDDDGGQLLPLEPMGALNDFRPALSTAAALFSRRDYAYVAGEASEQSLWLLGPRGLAAFDMLPKERPAATSRAFDDGGFYVTRDDWSSESNYMLIDAGPHGFLTAGHAHADALSFVLSVAGKPVFVDPGTCVYSSTDGERDRFRATMAHNTVTVGEASSSEPGNGPFQWMHVAKTKVERWTSDDRYDYLRGSHDGFSRLRPPARHERSILYVKGGYWVIRDRIIGASASPVRLHFHCAPGASVEVRSGDHVHVATTERTRVDLVTFGAGTFALHDDTVCPVYGRRLPAATCVFTLAPAAAAGETITFVLPGDASPPRVSRVASGVYEVACRDGRDTHQIGSGTSGAAATKWVWVHEGADGTREIVVDGDAPASRLLSAAEPTAHERAPGLARTGAGE